jgi:hypothetical protein
VLRAYRVRMTTNKLPRRRRPYCRHAWSPEQRLAYCTKPDPLSGCLIWQVGVNADGYGYIRYRRRRHLAHRLAWITKHGPIPKGLEVCHRCDERRCVNVDHLFLGTHASNMEDVWSKWRMRRGLGVVDARGRGGLPRDASPADIAPIRIVCDRFELLGDVVLRLLDPDVQPPTPPPAQARASRESEDTGLLQPATPGSAATPALARARRPRTPGSRGGRSARRSAARS